MSRLFFEPFSGKLFFFGVEVFPKLGKATQDLGKLDTFCQSPDSILFCLK